MGRWQKIPDKDFITLRNPRRIQLLADEDVEDEVVEYLKAHKVNVRSIKDFRLNGQSDESIEAFARKNKRVLLTKNGSDFLNDHKFPLNKIFGIIVIEGSMKNVDDYSRTITQVIQLIIPHAWAYERSKVKVSPYEMLIRTLDHTGHVLTTRYKIQNYKWYVWED